MHENFDNIFMLTIKVHIHYLQLIIAYIKNKKKVLRGVHPLKLSAGYFKRVRTSIVRQAA